MLAVEGCDRSQEERTARRLAYSQSSNPSVFTIRKMAPENEVACMSYRNVHWALTNLNIVPGMRMTA